MKLAEALILRSDIQKRMEQVKERLFKNVLVQEGEKASEDPGDLLKEYKNLQLQLNQLIKDINRTNSKTKFDDRRTLSEALVDRDLLLEKRNILLGAAEKATEKQDRYSRSEIKYVSIIDVKEYQKQADSLSKEYRNLDTKIQGMNWQVDLI